jgi:hypothetical protein
LKLLAVLLTLKIIWSLLSKPGVTDYNWNNCKNVLSDYAQDGKVIHGFPVDMEWDARSLRE